MLYTPVRDIELGRGITFCDLQRDTFCFRIWSFGDTINGFLLRQSPTFREQVSRIALDFVVISRFIQYNIQDPVGIESLPGLKDVQFNTSYRTLEHANMEIVGSSEREPNDFIKDRVERDRNKLREYGLVARTSGGEEVRAKHINWIVGQPRKRTIFSSSDLKCLSGGWGSRPLMYVKSWIRQWT
jgi:hypothetical protein